MAGLIGAGVWGLVRPGTVPLVLAGVLALLAVVGPLAVRFPQKADAADRLLDTLNVTPAIEEQFPALARGRAELDEVFARYERRVVIRETGLDVVPEAKQFPLQSVVWWSVVPGAITLLAVGAALLARRVRAP